MPKKNRIAIYELLFKEGVMVAKKDVHLAKHPELADKNVPNLHVMKAMQVSEFLNIQVIWIVGKLRILGSLLENHECLNVHPVVVFCNK